MFLWECISRQFERNPPRRSILSYRISWETENALSRHNLSRKYEFLLDTSGQSDIDIGINADLFSVRTIQPRISAEYLNDEDASCNTFKEKAIPTYLRPANLRVKWNWLPSGGFVCRTLNVTVLWTWDDSDIYNIGGLKPIRHIRSQYSRLFCYLHKCPAKSFYVIKKSTMWKDDRR